jgi:hypothetical protein
MMWRQLTPEEEVKFKKWARENYTPFTEINPVWHPAVKDECIAMNIEAEDQIEAAYDEVQQGE